MAHSKCNARGCTLHHHHHHRQETIETCTRTRAAPKNFSHFNSVAILFSENPFFFSSVFCVVVARDGVFLPLCASAAAATPWRRFMCTTTKHFTGMTPQKSHWDVSFGRKKKGDGIVVVIAWQRPIQTIFHFIVGRAQFHTARGSIYIRNLAGRRIDIICGTIHKH